MRDPTPGASHPAETTGGWGEPASADAEIARLERRLRLLAEHLPDMIFRYEYRPAARFDYVSPASTAISGYTPEDHYADPGLILSIVHPDDRERVAAGMVSPEDDEGTPILLRWVHRDGRVVTTEQRYRLERDEHGEVVAIEGVVRDVTGRLERQAALERELHHDPVTGLGNLRMLETELESHLAASHGELVVAVLRLDRLAIIRDLVGRSTAEAMLGDAAERLRQVAPAGSLLVKGDADDLFWLACPETGRSSGEEVLQRAHDAFRFPLSGAGREVYVTTTAGARLVDAGAAMSVESLLNEADAALRAVRGRGVRGRTRWFDEQLHRAATERLQLEHDLRAAVADGEITVAFQPQLELATGRIVGLEALARWDRPGHGPVSPARFIEVAEECGLVADLGDHVLYLASRQCARWRALGLLDQHRVSVNVSRRQLSLPDLADSVLEIAAANGLPPDGLTIEVTETAVMEARGSTEQLAKLGEAGVWISLDDFGTGQSALGSLRDLPIDELKLDRSFVVDLGGPDPGAVAICASVVALADGLGLELVAEGVETAEQSAHLQELGCRVGQGYLFSPAVGATEMAELLERSRSLGYGARATGT